MKILITGGTGLIGRALVSSLSSSGHQVAILSRRPDQAASFLPQARLVPWEIGNPEPLVPIIESTEAVVNLAGESIGGATLPAIFFRRWTPAAKGRILESRVKAGETLVNAIQMAEKKPRVLVQASAVGYYGPHGPEEVSESTPAGDDFLGRVCQAWENSTRPVEALGVRRVIIRTGLVLAPQGGILPVMLLPIRLFAGGPIGGGRQIISWIHLEDEVNAIRFLLENEQAQGAYNLTAPSPVSNAQFARIAGHVLKRPAFFPTPGFALRLILGEKASLVLDGQRATPGRLLAAGFEFQYRFLEEALRNLERN